MEDEWTDLGGEKKGEEENKSSPFRHLVRERNEPSPSFRPNRFREGPRKGGIRQRHNGGEDEKPTDPEFRPDESAG